MPLPEASGGTGRRTGLTCSVLPSAGGSGGRVAADGGVLARALDVDLQRFGLAVSLGELPAKLGRATHRQVVISALVRRAGRACDRAGSRLATAGGPASMTVVLSVFCFLLPGTKACRPGWPAFGQRSWFSTPSIRRRVSLGLGVGEYIRAA